MLRFDKHTKFYSADFTHRTFGRVHLRLKTKAHGVAMTRHAALEQLLDTGEPVRDLVDALRRRKLSILAVTECVRAKLPFDTLRASTWPTLGVGRDRYLKALQARESGAANTVLNTRSALNHAVAYFGVSARLEAITHDDVTAYKGALLAKGLASNTVAQYLTRLGGLYTFLNDREAKRARQLKRAPSTLFSPIDRDEHVPKMVQTRVRFLLEAEARVLLVATPPSIEVAIALGLFAGLRIGEVLMLRPGIDLSLDRSVIYIQSREGWHPKYGKNREVPISDALRPYCERHVAALPLTAPYVLPGYHPGSPQRADALHRIMRRIVTDAGFIAGRADVHGITFHTLRHSFASWLVMAGADLLTISKLMGHAGIRQVEVTYGHLSPGHLRETVGLLADKWFAAPSPVPAVEVVP